MTNRKIYYKLMKNNVFKFTATEEVCSIVCDLHSVELTIIPTQENELTIACENDKRLDISLDESTLKISQGNFNRIFAHRKKRIEMRVPDHTVPELVIDAKDSCVRFDGGIFGQLSLYGDDCDIECLSCSFAECTLTGGSLSTFLKGVTVKGMLIVKCDEGDMVWENSFAACTECRVKKGNIGLSAFNCKDSIMEAVNGNVAARLNGEESDYHLDLLIKEGTANRESVLREGAARSFKAYSAKGNIAIDFMPEDEGEAYGDN